MEPTAFVYVAVILGGVTLVSPDAIPASTCDALKQANKSIIWLCIDKEEDCGKAGGHTPCRGPVLDVPLKKTTAKRTTAKRRR